MPPEFLVDRDPGTNAIDILSRLDPTNPFYTRGYVDYRRRLDQDPILFLLEEEGRVLAGCPGFIKSGRLNTHLNIPSMPGSLPAGSAFWRGVERFCRDSRVSVLIINSFASMPGSGDPPIRGMAHRKPRWEYVIDLAENLPRKKMRKGHAYEIRRGGKAGLILRRSSDPRDCDSHLELLDASIERRTRRGEQLAKTNKAQLISFGALLESGVAELFQAVKDDRVVSSNIILLAPLGGYNHTQGTNAEGNKCGAAHFLLHEIALALSGDGRAKFNLGGTDQEGTGLERFKTGFSHETVRVELAAFRFEMASVLRRVLTAAAGLARKQALFGG